jgi:acylphosphatase
MYQCIKAIVRGRVQGVFFRAYTEEEARRQGLVGWVRNLADGDVEAMICGSAENIESMIKWLHTGSPMADVKEVFVTGIEPMEQLENFEIRY